MMKISFDESGSSKSSLIAVSAGDTLPVVITSEDETLSDAESAELTLSLNEPVQISEGVMTFSYSSDSVDLKCEQMSAYNVGVALNSLASIVSAGGVVTSEGDGGVHVRFTEDGARSVFTLSHSAAGSLTGRCIIFDAGGASTVASFLLDLSVDVLAQTTSSADISEAAISISTALAGDASTNQVQKITLTKTPDAGKFQIRVDDCATSWLRPDATAYSVQVALNNIAEGEFQVEKKQTGEVSEWTLTRNEKGAWPLATVSDTLIGPTGLDMSLNLGSVANVLKMTGIDSAGDCLLTFEYDGRTRFSRLVDMRPVLASHSAIA